MILKLDTPLKNLQGETYKENGNEVTVGTVIANVLDGTKEGGKMKLYVLAKKCFEEKTLDLDDADAALVRKAIENSNLTSNVVIGQLLMLFEKK